MPRWAVSFIAFTDNDLTTEIVEAESFHDAVFLHTKVQQDPEWKADLYKLNPEDVKQAFFDCDSMIEAIRIPKQ